MLEEYGGHIPAFATGTLGEPKVAAAGRRRCRTPRRGHAHGGARRPRGADGERPPGAQTETRRRRRRQPLDDDREAVRATTRAAARARRGAPGRAGPPGRRRRR